MSARDIGKALREARINAKMEVREVSYILIDKGIRAGTTTIYSWESGNSQPTPDALLILCQIYGITDVLGAFGYKKSPAPESEADMQKAKLIKLYDGLSHPGRAQLISHAEYLTDLESGQEPRKMAVAAHKGGVIFKDEPDLKEAKKAFRKGLK